MTDTPKTTTAPAPNFTLYDFLAIVIHIARTHNASITSYIRTPKHNAAVGGVANSRHLDGFGVDLLPDEPADLESIVIHAHNLGLRALNEQDHVHIEVHPGNRPFDTTRA
jgi:hypothetical protein